MKGVIQKMEKFEQISFDIDVGEIKDALRARDAVQIQTFLEVAKPLVSAQAAFRVCYIDEKLEDAVIIDGIRFGSRILRKNLEKVGRVSPCDHHRTKT
jgi:hypothetical protein